MQSVVTVPCTAPDFQKDGALVLPPGEQTKDSLIERFLSCEAEHFRPEVLQQRFLARFGAQAFHTSQPPFFYGLYRQNDLKIVTALLHVISSSPAGRTLRVLELGAGRSFADGEDFGSPWLARLFSQALTSTIKVTISDIMAARDRFVFFYCSPQGKLAAQTMTPVSNGRGSIRCSSLLGDGRFCPVPYPLVRKWAGDSDWVVDHTIEKLRGMTGCDPKSSGALFVRPVYDPQFERECYGIEAVEEVDFFERASKGPLQGRTFDFIFARHQAPTSNEQVRRTKNAALEAFVARLLEPSGTAIIHFDSAGGNPDTTLIQGSPRWPTIDLPSIQHVENQRGFTWSRRAVW